MVPSLENSIHGINDIKVILCFTSVPTAIECLTEIGCVAAGNCEAKTLVIWIILLETVKVVKDIRFLGLLILLKV